MASAPLNHALSVLFTELVDGATRECYVLNAGDPGLLRALDALSAERASAVPANGAAPIAAHVDHILYGLQLMSRWSAGEENPWKDADWTASWKRTSVSEDEWASLRGQLRDAAQRWKDALSKVDGLEAIELKGVIASVAHLAYHIGAIRQIDRSIRGPSAEQAV